MLAIIQLIAGVNGLLHKNTGLKQCSRPDHRRVSGHLKKICGNEEKEMRLIARDYCLCSDLARISSYFVVAFVLHVLLSLQNDIIQRRLAHDDLPAKMVKLKRHTSSLIPQRLWSSSKGLLFTCRECDCDLFIATNGICEVQFCYYPTMRKFTLNHIQPICCDKKLRSQSHRVNNLLVSQMKCDQFDWIVIRWQIITTLGVHVPMVHVLVVKQENQPHV